MQDSTHSIYNPVFQKAHGATLKNITKAENATLFNYKEELFYILGTFYFWYMLVAESTYVHTLK